MSKDDDLRDVAAMLAMLGIMISKPNTNPSVVGERAYAYADSLIRASSKAPAGEGIASIPAKREYARKEHT